MLVGLLHARRRGAVDAALVGEGAGADIRLVRVWRDVGDLRHEARELGQVGQVAAAGDGLESELERQVRPDGDEVGVAAALAVAVDGALDVTGTGLDGSEGVSHRQAGVVMNVDPEGNTAAQFGTHVPRQGGDLLGEAAAVGVAQHHRRRAGRDGGAQGGDRVGRIGLVAVEEVLGVVDDLAPGGAQEVDRLADHRQVLVRGRAEDVDDMEQPALAEDGGHRRLGGDQRAQVRILVRPVGAMAGRSERGQPGVSEGHAARGREELLVLRVGARPAALDVREAGLVEATRDLELVGQRQDEALALRAVAQGGVVQDDGGAVTPAPRLARRFAPAGSRRPPACRPTRRGRRCAGRPRWMR